MAEYVEVDVRGLSCPEPVLLAMDAMQDHPGKLIRVLGDEAHTRKNIEKMLEYENKSGQTTVRPAGWCRCRADCPPDAASRGAWKPKFMRSIRRLSRTAGLRSSRARRLCFNQTQAA